MGSYLISIVAILATIALAVSGLLLVRKNVELSVLRSFHEVAGYMLAIVGTLYAVVLGFIVVDALTTFQKARVMVEQEANSLADVYHLADGLPPQAKQNVRQLCINYAEAVVNSEWAAMESCQSSPEAQEAIHRLWSQVSQLNPKTEGDQNIHGQLLSELSQMGDCRRVRLVTAQHVFDPLIWSVLAIGAWCTIFFTYFFGLENLKVQILMTVILTLILSLNLFLVAMFGYPFAGDVKVYPDAFKYDLRFFADDSKTLPSSSGTGHQE